MLKATLFSFALIIFLSGNACINEYRTKLDGTILRLMPRSGKVHFRSFDTVEIQKTADQLWSQYKDNEWITNLSDYAAQLIYLGEYDKAKGIYYQIEKQRPNLYSTASNLGTIYELIGMPDSAYFWIERSMELNPQSHGGSEWIHLRILEYQLSDNANNPDYEGSVLGLDFGSEITPSNNKNYDLNQLEIDIRHQLSERLRFVQPENFIVGNIYFDLGNVLALYADLESALESYEEAVKFGFHSDLLNDRMREFRLLTIQTEFKSDVWRIVHSSPLLVFILLLGLIVVLLIIPIWLVRSSKRGSLKK